jgi:hypothetical protein
MPRAFLLGLPMIAIFVLAPARAHADPDASPSDDDRLLEHIHFGIGFDSTRGGGHTANLFRAEAGDERLYGTGSVRPALGLGVTVGGGCFNTDHVMPVPPGACDHMAEIGPELVAGLRFHSKDVKIDSRVYASISPLVDQIADRGDGVGVRAAIGATWLPLYAKLMGDDPGPSLLLFFLPWQGEIVYEHEAGSTRAGFSVMWGI